MTVDISTISHYFCIAPRSLISSVRSGVDSPLKPFLDPTLSPNVWSLVITESPATASISVTDYDDDKGPVMSTALHKLGIAAQSSELLPTDPSIFFRVFRINTGASGEPSRTVIIGFAYRVPGESSIATNSLEPATVGAVSEAPAGWASQVATKPFCANHPRTESVALCSYCHSYVCATCLRIGPPRGGVVGFFCVSCLPSGGNPDASMLARLRGLSNTTKPKPSGATAKAKPWWKIW